jgi:TIR domain
MLLLDFWASRFASGRSALPSIFINYRRHDSEGEAGRLFDELSARFGEDSVFMDVAAIEPGRDFRKAIDSSVATCSVLLAIIGLDWLDTRDTQQRRRLEDVSDFVRIELASALRRDIPVVPILVRGARMPHPEQLPDDLKELAYRNAVELTHARWKSDVQVLIRALEPYMHAAKAGQAGLNGGRHEPSTGRLESPQKPPAGVVSATETAAIDPQVIERVSRQLAGYIGPISDFIVKRAAKKSSTVDEFYGLVAREIKTDGERAKFLRSCRTPDG